MKITVTTDNTTGDTPSLPFLWAKDDGVIIYYCYAEWRSVALNGKVLDTSDLSYCWPHRLPRGTVVTLTVE